MRCTRCGGDLRVLNSRHPDGVSVGVRRRARQVAGDQDYIIRRRECVDCGQRFNTVEVRMPDRPAPPSPA